STLRKNSSGSGGALSLQAGSFQTTTAHVEISNSTFDDNQAVGATTGNGGAIDVGARASLNAVDSQFRRNSAHFGGAVYVSQGQRATFSGQNDQFFTSRFQFNVVTNTSSICDVSRPCSGGAIYSEGDLDVNVVDFFGNKA